jgi:hypothetical protein
MTLAKAKARANKTFMAQASVNIIIHNCQNSIIVQATIVCMKTSDWAAVIVHCVKFKVFFLIDYKTNRNA